MQVSEPSSGEPDLGGGGKLSTRDDSEGLSWSGLDMYLKRVTVCFFLGEGEGDLTEQV